MSGAAPPLPTPPMPPALVLLALLITVPLVEIYVLIVVGERIGAGPTVAAVVATAVLGTALLRQQGLSTLARAQASLHERRLPAMELVEGVLLFGAAVALLTPGFVTDALGAMVLVPPLRRALARGILGRATIHVGGDGPGGPGAGPDVIEGEFWREDEPRRDDDRPVRRR